ncbi:ATP-binding cassette sub-family C member 4-like [Oppia nitens]|uniref:ATP-binding cassette sub-family C member 4-like n=1 Tax=Oppia nitens TaxID=1686743 RepID=UPI0023DB383C|nr:ATP-binding cassette sub-family C member 4-like [Oppia nitens]
MIIQQLIIRISVPIMLGQVVRYFQGDPQITRQWAVWVGVGIVLMSLIDRVVINHLAFLYTLRMGMRMRVATSALIYRKTMKLSRSSLAQTTVGQILNILSNDVNRFDEFSQFSHSIIIAPLQSAIIGYILWKQLGWPCLASMAVIILFIPFQLILGSMFRQIRLRTSVLTDQRLLVMNEIISGMRVIKMYTWELAFGQLVSDIRKSEVKRIRNSNLLKGINILAYILLPRIIVYPCLVMYVLMMNNDNRLTADKVFVTVCYVNIMRQLLGKGLPTFISSTNELVVVIRRLEEFLALKEIKYNLSKNKIQELKVLSNISNNNNNNFDEKGVYIDNMTARWTNEIIKPTLNNISVCVKPGQLLAVIGSVGSGKSSLLMSVLNEMTVDSGSLRVSGRVSYAPQESWAFIASVRDNILFGSEYDEHRYQQVVNVCALDRDFQLFPFGDRTLVGEKGVLLSGGQKSRISLARAIYRQADIYLLDDPLSAVDTQVVKHIFQNCIIDYLKDKTRILVTHQIQFLQVVDKILVLDNGGQCIALGSSYDEISKQLNNINLMSYQQNNEYTINTNGVTDGCQQNMDQKSLSTKVMASNSHPIQDIMHTNVSNDLSTKLTDKPVVLVKPETKMIGSIDSMVYWAYVRAGARPLLMSTMILMIVLSQLIFQGIDYWLSYWTSNNQNDDNQSRNIIIYSSLIVGLCVTSLLATISFYMMSMRSSISLHNRIFTKLLRAPIDLFECSPAGRILNRFSKDIGIIDEQLPSAAFEFIINLVLTIGNLVINAIVNWFLVFPAIVLILMVFMCRYFYIKAGRDIKRLDGLSRSPIYSHVSNTLAGLSTIRSLDSVDMFDKQFEIHMNDNTATYFLFICTSRAFGVLMDGICIVYIAAVLAVVMSLSDSLTGGNAGLVLSSSLTLIGTTHYSVKCCTDFEAHMTAVERVLEYSRIKPEADLRSAPDRKPSTGWPQSGCIEFRKISLQYAESPVPVLNEITVAVKGGEKIGIIGRTGAGKSSIISALFRLTEPTSGQILIDGIDIQSIGLHDLRRKISIIPQEPILFTGSVRKNLDPFDEHPDYRLWSALDEVQLRDAVNQLPDMLDGMVSEGGSNFSVGQRQLICLARAILRNNRILVLDEATANVDHQTDALIQRTIRDKFCNCTVITIAHRLNTIIDSDKVLVLDEGKVIEYGIPYILLKSGNSLFARLVSQTGNRMANRLRQMAKHYYSHKYGEQLDERDSEN